METTVIFYSSNKEHPDFEQRIIDNLKKSCGNLPIISVTQKPTDLGKNIVVGDVGVSGYNMFRQVLIACKEANTKFVISAEADCVYPPDYFTFIPLREDICYRNSNLYVMGQYRDYFYKKPGGATHAQIVGRKFYIETLEKLFGDSPMWSTEEFNFPKERSQGKQDDVFWRDKIEYYESDNPVVQIKTNHSMRHYTASERIPIKEIPYWGNGKDFREKFYEIGLKH